MIPRRRLIAPAPPLLLHPATLCAGAALLCQHHLIALAPPCHGAIPLATPGHSLCRRRLVVPAPFDCTGAALSFLITAPPLWLHPATPCASAVLLHWRRLIVSCHGATSLATPGHSLCWHRLVAPALFDCTGATLSCRRRPCLLPPHALVFLCRHPQSTTLMISHGIIPDIGTDQYQAYVGPRLVRYRQIPVTHP